MNLLIIFLLAFSLLENSYSNIDTINQNKHFTEQKEFGNSQASPCDQTLWSHIYNPDRLRIIDLCRTVAGTIVLVRVEKDGDDHILLHLDPGQSQLLNAKNISSQQGDLVLEPIYVHHPTQADAIPGSYGYRNTICIPHIGDHVSVTGSYVLDMDHGWMEIHPVSHLVIDAPHVISSAPSSKINSGSTEHSYSTDEESGVRIGAICRDGTRSYATGRGACSHHGGVDHWLYK